MIHDSSNYLFDAHDWLNYSHQSCNDQVLETVVFQNNSFQDMKGNSFLSFDTKNNQGGGQRKNIDYSKGIWGESSLERIVLLLESPSNDEYEAKGYLGGTAPCWGATGDMIREKFLEIMNNRRVIVNGNPVNNFENIINILKVKSNNKYDLCAVNSIRYQCDLGNPGGGKNTRNIFEKLWNKEGFKDDLLERLTIINPKLIINCCTKMISDKINLTAILKKSFDNNVLECSHHPCVWLQPKIVRIQ